MKLIAKKVCNFGKRFYIGEEIPLKAVLDPQLQEKRGVLTIVNDDDAGTAAPAAAVPGEPGSNVTVFPVIIHAKEGDLSLNLAPEDVQTIVDILTSNVEAAEPIVAQMTNAEALILLDCIDNRKSIKTAAKERALALNEAATEETHAADPESTEPENPEESEGEQ